MRLTAWLLLGWLLPVAAQEAGIELASPGFALSRLDPAGRLTEDWGAIEVRLSGDGLPADGDVTVSPAKLDGLVPAAQASSQRGPVRLTLTAFRSPVWPAGLDVLTARVEETSGAPFKVALSLALPEGAQVGPRTVAVGGRQVVLLPDRALAEQPFRDGGWWDAATSLPGWARPEAECDPIFRNIRAGLGGVPIVYRFKVDGGAARVALGLCESHWAEPGQRPLICKVEGAEAQAVDPLERWGRHKPGVLLFDGRDADANGWLDVIVTTAVTAPDRNPILNAIWLFPAGAAVDPAAVVAGRLTALATRVVDCGAADDLSLVPEAKVEYSLELAANGSDELTFLVAPPGGSVPDPELTAWTPTRLREAAKEVWRGWR